MNSVLLISVGVFLLSAHSKGNFTNVALEDYVPLIVEIRDYYRTSIVFLAHAGDLYGDYGDLRLTHIVHTWSRLLSRHGIVTLDVHFKKMYRVSRYFGKSVRPLFLVILIGEDSYHEFSMAAQNFKMSFAVWFLIFVLPPSPGKHDYCHEPIGNPFNITFNAEMLILCPDDNVLREWYSIDDKTTTISDLAYWHINHVPSFVLKTNHSLYERRKTLGGKTLKGVYVKNSPFLKIENGVIAGYFGQIMRELIEIMNFTLELHVTNRYGSISTKNKTWNGAIAEVMSGKADIGLSDFSMTESRLNAVEYLLPLVICRNRLFVKQPDVLVVQWFAYFKTFNCYTWAAILATISITSVLIATIYVYLGSKDVTQLFFDSLLSVWGIFCQQSLSVFPQSTALRVAYFTTFMVALVISAAYSAALICFLTAGTRILPFHTIDEFLQDGTFRLIVMKHGADYDMFAQSNDEAARNTMKLMMPKNTLPKSIQEGFEQICQNPKLVFYTAEEKKRPITFGIPCQVTAIDNDRVDSISMILPKDSPYTDIFNHNLHKFMDNGMMQRFKYEHMKLEYREEIIFNPVELNSVAPILTIFSVGVALSLIILCIEKYIMILKTKTSINMRNQLIRKSLK